MKSRYVRSHVMRLALTFLLIVSLLLPNLPIAPARADETEPVQSAMPTKKYCTLYFYDEASGFPPTFYAWNDIGNVIYRVYANDKTTLLGTGITHSTNGNCTIALDRSGMAASNSRVYVTRQAPGETESVNDLAFSYTKAATPSVNLKTYLLGNAAQQGGRVSYQLLGQQKAYIGQLEQNKYYVMEVSLSNFTKLQTVTLPIHYDPNVFELQTMSYTSANAKDGGVGYEFSGNAVTTPEEGTRLSVFGYNDDRILTNSYLMGGNPTFGIGIFPDLLYWNGIQDTDDWSDRAQTPYVNTNTGLIKLEFHSDNDDLEIATLNGTTSTERKLVRIYFKCILDQSTLSDAEKGQRIYGTALNWATKDDVPAGIRDEYVAQRYYCTTSPDGYTATIFGQNLLAPPMALPSGATSLSPYTVSSLTAAQIYSLPTSLSAADNLRQLLENRVKVYNYTNSGDYGMDLPANDVLLLTASSGTNGAAKAGDVISVYDSDSATTPIATGTANEEGGVRIDLGTDKLDPGGGYVYVSIKRLSSTGTTLVESNGRVPIYYAAEMDRNVHFKIRSSRLPDKDEGKPANSNAVVGNRYSVIAGEQITIDIFFDHFEDLLSYTFNLEFDSTVVQATDKTFHTLLNDGYITEQDLLRGDSCIVVGDAMTPITLNENMAYLLWEDYQAGEIDGEEALERANALGIADLDALKEVYDAVKIKMATYGSRAWNGGLLFTGDVREPYTNGANDPGRREDEVYPYVSNGGDGESGNTGKGILRFASASLDTPPLALNSSNGEGYHFLTLYFTAVVNGDPDFKFSGTAGTTGRGTDGEERVPSKNGTEVVISGPGISDPSSNSTAATVSPMNFTAQWTLYKNEEIPKTAQIRLYDGNSKDADDASVVYLYNDCRYRDPGFLLRSSIDATLFNTATSSALDTTADNAPQLVRHYAEIDDITDDDWWKTAPILEDWTEDEELLGFHIPEGKYSATYKIAYVYTNPDGDVETVETRTVYVINRRGDFNGDGKVNVFDEQYILDHSDEPAWEDDPLFMAKTYLDPDDLHTVIMTGTAMISEYKMLAEPAVSPMGFGREGSDNFRMWLEFYPASADPADPGTPLEYDAIPQGKDVIAVIRYENISDLVGTDSGGLRDLGFSFYYDSTCYTLNGFQTRYDDEAVEWAEAAIRTNAQWATWEVPAGIADAADALDMDAYDRPYQDDTREIYIQFLSLLDPEDGEPVFLENDGVLAAFSFKVANKEFEANFDWLDYDIAVLNTTDEYNPVMAELSQQILRNGTTQFKLPAMVTTASVVPTEPTGYTITGEVTSYNAANPITYALYKWNGTGYETTAAYSGTLVEAESTNTAGQHTQSFGISDVEAGTYKLVISKASHCDFVVTNIVLISSGISLKDDSRERAHNIKLGVGDMDNTKTVNVDDLNEMIDSENYNRNVDSVRNKLCDIDGSGAVNIDDLNILMDVEYYNKGTTLDYTI